MSTHNGVANYIDSLELPDNVSTDITKYITCYVFNKNYNEPFDKEIEGIKSLVLLYPKFTTDIIAVFSHFLNNLDTTNFSILEEDNIEQARASLYELVVLSLEEDMKVLNSMYA